MAVGDKLSNSVVRAKKFGWRVKGSRTEPNRAGPSRNRAETCLDRCIF